MTDWVTSDLHQGLRSSLDGVRDRLLKADPRPVWAPIREVRGPLVLAQLPSCSIGEMCSFHEPGQGFVGFGQVTAFTEAVTFVAPYFGTAGLSSRTQLRPLRRRAGLQVSPSLCGAVLDAFGTVVRRVMLSTLPDQPPRWSPFEAAAPPPFARRRIERQLATGIRVVDTMTPVGLGQRIGIVGTAGTGKSTLVTHLAQGCRADVVVIGLVGERGREVGDMVARLQDASMMDRCVIVTSTSDRPPLERITSAFAATAIAEYFRDNGQDVLLIIDSVTRAARAVREIGLASGEVPTRTGLTPSVLAFLPALFERAGLTTSGSMTGIYTVLAEDPDVPDALVEECRSLLDGHILLSSALLQSGQRPAVDVLASQSRVMSDIADAKHQQLAANTRSILALCREVEFLLRVGEYKRGGDAATDAALDRLPRVKSVFRQAPAETSSLSTALKALHEAVA
jgi:type III secretion protein N (ATPase)